MSWDEGHARAGIAQIVADAERAFEGTGWPAHELDQPVEPNELVGLYLGSAGMLWALRRLGSTLDVPIDVSLIRDDPSLLVGETGVLLVERTDDARLQQLIDANAQNPTWKLLWGSPGTIIAARHAGLDGARSAELLVEAWADGLWTQTLYGREFRMLGPAHGFAGNLHALRRHLPDDELRARAESVLRAHAVWDETTVNWPPEPGAEPDRVQWCHGAPGIVATLGDLMSEDLLLAGAELTWRHGPHEKGPGLCHGTAGNGYALLKTYAVTGDELWLERARSFAMSVLDQLQQRYSLFTGDVGAALYLQSCIDADARFPIMDLVWAKVKLSSADRVLFPDDGITKGDLFNYYDQVADFIVPHLKDRPFTMKRWREGLPGGSFFQKQAPKGMPDWIPTRQFRTWPRGGKGESRLVDFPLVNSRDVLLWMVQMHCIDMNAWYSRVDKPDRPDFVLFDLDPPEEDGAFALCIRVAHLVHDALDRLGLESYVKTSGADGIHVVLPIARRSTYDETYEFAELLSRQLEAEHPGEVTTEWLKKKRSGVLVDHRQNGHGKTIASVYSVRPKPGAPVSTPLRWDELTEDVRPRDFTMQVALERVAKHGDLFEPVLHGKQALGPALKKLRARG